MNEKKRAIINGIAQVLSTFEEVDFAYIFGSFVTRDSFEDIDVALGMSGDFQSHDQLKLSSEIATALERNIKPRHEFDVKALAMIDKQGVVEHLRELNDALKDWGRYQAISLPPKHPNSCSPSTKALQESGESLATEPLIL